MSKNETKNTEQKQEKVMTKYDLKMQRRKEQKEKELKAKRRSQILGIALVVALACLVASFPIRNYLAINGTYIKVDGEKITKIEYDYNYNLAKTGYLSQYGYYLTYLMGMDLSQDFDDELMTEKLTWGDYFDELAVDNMLTNKALLKEAKAAGFEYDTTADYEEYKVQMEAAAVEAGMTVADYIQSLYGAYATEKRVKPYIDEAMYISAYYDSIYDQFEPTQAEIEEYYNNNTASYDSVDYYVSTVDAELPTEPTELADPVEETAAEDKKTEGSTTEGTTTEGTTEDGTIEAEPYEPSEAEIAAAMEKAKAKAEKAEKTIKASGELMTNVTKTETISILADWLFAEERKAGDTTVIEDATNNRYYVLRFEKRYLDQSPTADVRIIMTADGNGEEILNEWKSGAATEESFAELADKYNDTSVITAEGGYMEGLVPSGLGEELEGWIYDSARAAGETAVIAPEDDEYSYVIYYVGANEAEWLLSIKETLWTQSASDYLAQIKETVELQDPKGNLYYLEVQAEEEAAAAASSEASGAAE